LVLSGVQLAPALSCDPACCKVTQMIISEETISEFVRISKQQGEADWTLQRLLERFANMNTQITFKSKNGRGGRRNRRAARRAEERQFGPANVRIVHQQREVLNRELEFAKGRFLLTIKRMAEVAASDQVKRSMTRGTVIHNQLDMYHTNKGGFTDLSQDWNEAKAKYAIELHAKSHLSGRAFAALHGFPENRLRAWRKRLGL
jgi:hypothetical protein